MRLATLRSSPTVMSYVAAVTKAVLRPTVQVSLSPDGPGEALKEANRLSAAENVTTARDVFSAAGSDPLMKRIVDDTAKYLGASIGGLHNLLDLDVVVIGGGVSQAGEWFIEAVERSARSFMLDPDEHGPQIVASSLGDDSVLWGAARLTQELRRE